MTVEEFSEYYGVSRAAIHVSIHNKLVPKSIFYKQANSNLLHVDKTYFDRRMSFRKMVYRFIQDMYYFHYKPWFTDGEIAQMWGVTQTYIMYDMWSPQEEAVFRFKVPKTTWKAFRKCRMVWRVCYKRYNPDFDLEKELDWMAGISA